MSTSRWISEARDESTVASPDSAPSVKAPPRSGVRLVLPPPVVPDAYFDAFVTRKYKNSNPIQRALIRRFVQQLCYLFVAAGPAKSVLELGVGEGFISGYLAEQFPEKHFTGLDACPKQLDLLRARFPRVRAKHGDITDLSFLEDPYDVVMCIEVLEHIRDPERAVNEMADLGPRRALITVPHEPFFMLGNLMRGKNVRRLGNDIDHCNHFGPRSLRRLLEKRFEVLRLTQSFPWLLALCKPR